jgi:hypothetical protein
MLTIAQQAGAGTLVKTNKTQILDNPHC